MNQQLTSDESNKPMKAEFVDVKEPILNFKSQLLMIFLEMSDHIEL